MEAINLTQSQLAERFRIEVELFNEPHLFNMIKEVLNPDVNGTERIDLMASSMKPHTEVDQQTIAAILHWEIAKVSMKKVIGIL